MYKINPLQEFKSTGVTNINFVKKEVVKEVVPKNKTVRPSVIKPGVQNNQLALRYIYNSDMSI
jgi:hypothetical protein